MLDHCDRSTWILGIRGRAVGGHGTLVHRWSETARKQRGVHSESRVADLSPRKLEPLIAQARQYSVDFLEWRRQLVPREHWLVHRKCSSPTCGSILSRKYLGITNRRTFFCRHYQLRD